MTTSAEPTPPTTRLAFPVTAEDRAALLARLRNEGFTRPTHLTLADITPELLELHNWCRDNWGRTDRILTLEEVAEAIRVGTAHQDTVGQASKPRSTDLSSGLEADGLQIIRILEELFEEVAYPNNIASSGSKEAPKDASNQGKREPSASKEIPARKASPSEVPFAEAAPDEDLSDLDHADAAAAPRVSPALIRDTAIGVAIGVGASLFSRKLGLAVLGWTALRYWVCKDAPVTEDELFDDVEGSPEVPSSDSDSDGRA